MPMSEQADETMWPHSFLVHLIPVDCEGFAPISQIATLRPKECDFSQASSLLALAHESCP